LAILSEGSPLFERSNVDSISTGAKVSYGSADANKKARLLLLPPVFEAKVFYTLKNKAFESFHMSYDDANQRRAVHGINVDNTIVSLINFCHSGFTYAFNKTFCEKKYLPCDFSRNLTQFLMREDISRLTFNVLASFTLGSAVGGIPVDLWTVRGPSAEGVVLLNRDTNIPIQVNYRRFYTDISVLAYVTDVKLTVDREAFYTPLHCKLVSREKSPILWYVSSYYTCV
jgi:hypothetical protein